MATVTIKEVALRPLLIYVKCEFNDVTIPLIWTECVEITREECSAITTQAEFKDMILFPKVQSILDKYKRLKTAADFLTNKINQAVTI
jgi:hypothetical protein